MTRLMLMTFFTKKRWEDGVHPHESPAVMTVPLIVLAALSVLGGVMLAGDWIVDFLSPVVGHVEHEEPPLPAIVITLIVVAVVAVGVGAGLVPRAEARRAAGGSADVSFVTKAARADLYGDAINDGLVVRPGGQLVTGLVAHRPRPRRRRLHRRRDHRRRHRPGPAPAADRLRPVLRAVRARGRA